MKTKSEILENVKEYAFVLHSKTNHMYDVYPYSLHLSMVVENILEYISFEDSNEQIRLISAAYLHDSIEDTRTTYNDLINGLFAVGVPMEIAMDIANIVYAVTNNKGRTRKERANDDYYNGIKENKDALIVKLADRLANVQFSKMFIHSNVNNARMLASYRVEHSNFLLKLGLGENTDKDSKEYPFLIKINEILFG